MRGLEVVYRSKKLAVMHIASMKRMQELFSLCGLCGAQFFKVNGWSYVCSGKVDIVQNGQYLLGYIMEEIGDRWRVRLEDNTDVQVRRVYYHTKRNGYTYPLGQNSRRNIISQYWPIRIMVSITGDCRITLNRLTFNDKMEVVHQLSS